MRGTGRGTGRSTGWHWWAVTKDEATGRPYLVYLCPDSEGGESAARQRGIELMQGLNFDLVRYRTRNLQQARSFLAGRRLETGLGLRDSARQQGHEKSLVRLRKRIRQKGIG